MSMTEKHDGRGMSSLYLTVENKISIFCEGVFFLKERQVTVRSEAYCGFIQFISCLFILPVIPEYMALSGYDKTQSIIATAVTCFIGCLLGGLLTNLPFIIAPPTAVSIFLAAFLQQEGYSVSHGNDVVILSGLTLLIAGIYPPTMQLITRLIPDCIQAATAIGIGLLTALAGATEIGLVVQGDETVVKMGEITTEVIVAMVGLIIIGVCLHYHVKGSFCVGLLFGTFVWWIHVKEDLTAIGAKPHLESAECGFFSTSCTWTSKTDNNVLTLLMFDLIFLYILTLNGLSRSLSDLGHLTKQDGAIPGGRWLFLVCGFVTVLSGFMSGAPVLISPESAAGIKAGAKTGLSTCVCGLLFGLSAFFAPLFRAVPPAATAPLLIIIGVLLFQNVKRIDWAETRLAIPAFCCLFFIPFTYSIAYGVYIAYVIYIIIGMFTGDFWLDTIVLIMDYYLPSESLQYKTKRSDGYRRGNGGDYTFEGDACLESDEKTMYSRGTASALDCELECIDDVDKPRVQASDDEIRPIIEERDDSIDHSSHRHSIMAIYTPMVRSIFSKLRASGNMDIVMPALAEKPTMIYLEDSPANEDVTEVPMLPADALIRRQPSELAMLEVTRSPNETQGGNVAVVSRTHRRPETPRETARDKFHETSKILELLALSVSKPAEDINVLDTSRNPLIPLSRSASAHIPDRALEHTSHKALIEEGADSPTARYLRRSASMSAANLSSVISPPTASTEAIEAKESQKTTENTIPRIKRSNTTVSMLRESKVTESREGKTRHYAQLFANRLKSRAEAARLSVQQSAPANREGAGGPMSSIATVEDSKL